MTVVGIGASAGGLIALQTFFNALPADIGMAFVVVTHLHPEHESYMAELLQKHTSMPVLQVRKRTPVESNHVYVIPPNRSILMTNSHLDTHEFADLHARRTPIDHFFRSMAQSGHNNPVAIILSGGGTDGSVGIKDIKEVGGLIMVQQPEDSEYDSMPLAAIRTGMVDVSLPAAELARKLTEYIRHRPNLPHDPGQLTDSEVETLERILAQVHSRTGHDFSHYKRSTILRRVERRMQLNSYSTLEAYLTYLRGNQTEAQAMFNDILIGVTNFFRDRASWQALQELVIPNLVHQGGIRDGEGLRIWSIGCATGEEAYGLAILFLEEFDKQGIRPQIQIFASDLDERSITHAREGLFPAAIEADVSSERLERFFTREGQYYRIRREVRDLVLFTNHNVLRDPPFSRQNLITCRNVLIYLQRPVQDRLFDIFHYSLHPGGYIYLGTSESAEHLPDLFAIVDKTNRLYKAKPWMGVRHAVPNMPLSMSRSPRREEAYTFHRPQIARLPDEPILMEEHHQRALESYGPPSVIVNDRSIIKHVSENAGRYLRQPKGTITSDLLTLVRPELQLDLRSALFHAFDKGKATVSRPIAVQFDGHTRRVVVAVRPQQIEPAADRSGEWEALVFFIEDEEENPELTAEDEPTPQRKAEMDEKLKHLQVENQRLRQQLQITVEDNESSNVEMKAANEELQSINEEYRSATEELETSKEELQSVNEELQTVNSEMRNKLEEVLRARQELENLMGATDIATLYLDLELRIQRYTAGVQELFSITTVDRGRRISDLTHKLGYETFLKDADQVLIDLIPVERELKMEDGRWLLMRLRPYWTIDDRIEGVVTTFIDISKLKETEQELVRARDLLEERVQNRTSERDEANLEKRQARDLFQALFHANPIPTALTRLSDNIILDVNNEFLSYFGSEREQILGRSLDELDLGLNLNSTEGDAILERLRREGRLGDIEIEINHPSGEKRHILASIQYLNVDGTETLISTFIDITDRVLAEQEIRSLASELTVAETKERSRISQMLHDDLQQRIFAVKVQLANLFNALRKGSVESVEEDLNQIQTVLTESIAITRNLSIDLSPAILQGDSLVDALTWLASQMQDHYGLQVDVESNGVSTRFDDALRILIYQAVREALFNIVKHAETLQAFIRFEEVDSQIRLTIGDEGKGFDINEVKSGKDRSGGLMNFMQRLNLLGCDLQMTSEPGKGTRVMIDIPVSRVK